MTYNELQNAAAKQRIALKDIAASMNLTPQGLRTSFVNQTFPIGKVLPLCKIIGISPNNFFGVSENATMQYNNTLCQIGTAVNSPTAISTLQKELAEKNEQIKQLLNIITKLQQ